MAKIAHTQKDATKRRNSFEERWKVFQGNMFDTENIRKSVFTHIDSRMLKQYYGKCKNPLFGFKDGVFSYIEEPLRQALDKAKADLSQFQMNVFKEKKPMSTQSNLDLRIYDNVDKTWCHTCLLTYKDIEMKIERWEVEDSPFGTYIITPALQLPCEREVVPDTIFFWLDIPRLLMDLDLEYSLCKEEFNYHLRKQKVFNMDTSVMDESTITLSDNPDEWMPTIKDYFMMMRNRYNDPIPLENLRKPFVGSQKHNAVLSRIYGYQILTPYEEFVNLCNEKKLDVEFKIGNVERLKEPSRTRREFFFMVDGYVLYIEEFLYYNSTKDKCIVYPYHQHSEHSFTINGRMGLQALVGYLKLMPEICQQIDKKLSVL